MPAGHNTGGTAGLQRARGAVRVAFGRQPATGAAHLTTLYQSGSSKCLLPRVSGPMREAVLLNTAGGITGGDVFDVEVSVAETTLAVTSQTAERIYRSVSGSGQVRNRLTIGPGGRLDWLPQETILFDGGRLDRRLDVDMAEDASLWAVESVVLGRTAMGEQVETGSLSDQWRIRRGGRLIHADGLRLRDRDTPDGDRASILDICGHAATANGRPAMASVVHVSPDAEDLLPRARALIGTLAERTGHDVRLAASAWNGLLGLRAVAASGHALKTALASVLSELRGSPMPRVWTL